MVFLVLVAYPGVRTWTTQLELKETAPNSSSNDCDGVATDLLLRARCFLSFSAMGYLRASKLSNSEHVDGKKQQSR